MPPLSTSSNTRYSYEETTGTIPNHSDKYQRLAEAEYYRTCFALVSVVSMVSVVSKPYLFDNHDWFKTTETRLKPLKHVR